MTVPGGGSDPLARRYSMPGDDLGPCPCGHRHAMCHRANAAKYCPSSESDELRALRVERDTAVDALREIADLPTPDLGLSRHRNIAREALAAVGGTAAP